MATVAASFTATGVGARILVRHGEQFTYDVSGTFVGTVVLERTRNGGVSWELTGISATGAASGTVLVETPDRAPAAYRFRCSAFTSGTIVTALVDVTTEIFRSFLDNTGTSVLDIVEGGASFPGNVTVTGSVIRTSQKKVFTNGAKVGATSGWVVGAATNVGRAATCPASQTASTLVIQITGLKVGDTITGFHLIGQIESAGETVTVDADLRKLTAAAADLTDASVGAITQLSVTADTIMSLTNTTKGSLTEVVGPDETFYILITATTGASTDIDLQGVAVIVTES